MINNIFIQARMSSSRFPGKVLAPLQNIPLIKHVVNQAKQTNGINKVVVLTSAEESDDPLVSYLQNIKCDFFRGSLNNVYDRFCSALNTFPCDYFMRLSADSPFINNGLISYMIQNCTDDKYDIISNVLVRSFPKGQSVEIIKSKIFMSVNQNTLTAEDKEHVFPYFYRNRNLYKVLTIKNYKEESHLNFCIDTLQDLQRLSSSNIDYEFQLNEYAE